MFNRKSRQQPQHLSGVRQSDLPLLNDLNAALQEERSWGLMIVVGLLVVLVTVFVVWATFSDVEEVTRGQGRVISSSREQVIQSLDPGVVSEILVKEGDIVEKDQIILRLDDNRSGALYREVVERVRAVFNIGGNGSSIITASAAIMPDFIAVCVPLMRGTFRKPALSPISAPPGNASFGTDW